MQQNFGLTTAPQFDNARGQNEKYLHSSNGSNAANGGWYVPTASNMLYAWNGVNLAGTEVRANLIANFNTSPYSTLGNIYSNPALLYQATAPAPLSASVTATPSGGNLNLGWLSGFVGIFEVTAYVSDGAAEVQQSFFVVVS